MLTRKLDEARQAFASNDAAASRQAHQTRSREEHRSGEGQYVKSIIYGGLDGIITTFAVVAGVEGASLSPGVVMILGGANLLADGLSMAIGDFLSTRSEQEYNRAERRREAWEVEHYPEGEKQELIELYTAKGIPEADAHVMVEALAKHPEAWVDVMMVQELGILESEESPLRNALATFLSFTVLGLVPLLTPLAALIWPALRPLSFGVSAALTAAALFALGAMKTRLTLRSWWRSGLEMLVVGGVAAATAYGVGFVLSGLQ